MNEGFCLLDIDFAPRYSSLYDFPVDGVDRPEMMAEPIEDFHLAM